MFAMSFYYARKQLLL